MTETQENHHIRYEPDERPPLAVTLGAGIQARPAQPRRHRARRGHRIPHRRPARKLHPLGNLRRPNRQRNIHHSAGCPRLAHRRGIRACHGHIRRVHRRLRNRPHPRQPRYHGDPNRHFVPLPVLPRVPPLMAATHLYARRYRHRHHAHSSNDYAHNVRHPAQSPRRFVAPRRSVSRPLHALGNSGANPARPRRRCASGRP